MPALQPEAEVHLTSWGGQVCDNSFGLGGSRGEGRVLGCYITTLVSQAHVKSDQATFCFRVQGAAYTRFTSGVHCGRAPTLPSVPRPACSSTVDKEVLLRIRPSSFARITVLGCLERPGTRRLRPSHRTQWLATSSAVPILLVSAPMRAECRVTLATWPARPRLRTILQRIRSISHGVIAAPLARRLLA